MKKTNYIILSISTLLSLSLFGATDKKAKPAFEKSYIFMTKDIQVNQQAENLRLEAQKSILDILNNRKGIMPERKYELKLRLGEIFLERYEYHAMVETKNYDVKFKNWEKTSKTTPMPKRDLKRAKSFLDRGIFVLENLVKSYPKHARTDAALFALGKSMLKKDDVKGVKYFNTLITQFPKSKLVTDSNLAVGEYYFELYKMDQARPYYQAAVKNKKHENYTYAVYKLAWTIYNKESSSEAEKQANLQKTLGLFKAVVKLSKSETDKKSLRDEAMNDMVVVFADIGNDQAAWKYFEKSGEKSKYFKFLERLGHLHSESGKYAQSVSVYNKLIKLSPNRKSIPDIYQKLVTLYESLEKPEQIYQTLDSMNKLTNPKSKWLVANSKEADKVKDVKAVVESQTMRFGTIYHQQSQNNKSNITRNTAIKFYDYYVDNFPKSKKIFEVRYYLAEINYDLEKYINATKNFYFVAKNAPVASKFKKLAADGMVDSSRLEVLQKKYPDLPKLGTITKPMNIPEAKKLYISTLDLYIKLYPKDTKVAEYFYRTANVKFNYGHYDNSVSRYSKVIEVAPSSEYAMMSAQKTLGYYVENKRWEPAIASSMKFLQNKTLLKPKLKVFVINVLKTSSFKLGEEFESKKQYAKAGDQFEKYVRLFPKDLDSNKAYNNSIANFYKAKQIDKALVMSESFIKASPKSPLVVKISGILAGNLEKIGSFEKSAKYYEKHFALTRGEKVSQKDKSSGVESLYSAGLLYKALGNIAQTQRVFSSYTSIVKNPQKQSDISIMIAEMLSKNNQMDRAIAEYTKVVKMPASPKENMIFAQAKIYDVRILQGDQTAYSDISQMSKQLVSIKDVDTQKAREICANHGFNMVKKSIYNYSKVKVNSYKDLEVQAAQKQNLLTGLSEELNFLTKLAVPEVTLAAKYSLAAAVEDFSTQLKSVLPKDPQTIKQDAQFIAEINNISNNLSKQSVDFYKQAFAETSKVKKVSSWSKKARSKYDSLVANNKTKTIKDGFDYKNSQLSIKPVYMGLDFSNKDIVESLSH